MHHRTEQEIMQNWKGDLTTPVVSICCATYNHENFILDALHGFLRQVTTFPFEIIIRDDASTDGTTQIVREYAKKYPHIIRAVIEQENQFSKNVRAIHIWPILARGKYIALCEGDDYWISSCKLQQQVELLEKHPEAVMSVAKTDFFEQCGDDIRYIKTLGGNGNVIQGFNEINKSYFHTSTYVIKSTILQEIVTKYIVGHTLFGDTALRNILITQGPFVFLPEIVSVYRLTGNGIWTSLDRDKQLKWELATAQKLFKILSGVHKRHQCKMVLSHSRKLLRFYIKNGPILEGIQLIPLIFKYRLIKKLGYIQRKLTSVSRRLQNFRGTIQ